MATATSQDDDLLIITDDSGDSQGEEIKFSFDEEENTSETQVVAEKTSPTSEDAGDIIPKQEATLDIDLSGDDTQAKEVEVSQAEESTSEASLDLDISFDESDSAPEETAALPEAKKEEETMDFNLDLSSESTSSEESSTPVAGASTATSSDESLNDILSATIAKLEERKSVISSDSEAKKKQEDDIKAEIKKLQDKVEALEADMKNNSMESDKIVANIAELEKMKLDPVKDHNAKRIAKK